MKEYLNVVLRYSAETIVRTSRCNWFCHRGFGETRTGIGKITKLEAEISTENETVSCCEK